MMNSSAMKASAASEIQMQSIDDKISNKPESAGYGGVSYNVGKN